MSSILRWTAVFQVLAVAFQAASAGQFLSGAEAAVRFHEVGGWAIAAVAVVQLGISLIVLRAAAAPLSVPIASGAVLLAIALQIGTGYGRFPAVHVPLGVMLFGAAVGQAVWLFREPQKKATWG